MAELTRDILMKKEAPEETYPKLGKDYVKDLSNIFDENKPFLKMATTEFNPVLRVYSLEEGDDKLKSKSNNRESFIKNKQAELARQQPIMPPLPEVKLLSKFGKFGTFSQDTKVPAASQTEQKQKSGTPKKGPGSPS